MLESFVYPISFLFFSRLLSEEDKLTNACILPQKVQQCYQDVCQKKNQTEMKLAPPLVFVCTYNSYGNYMLVTPLRHTGEEQKVMTT